MVAKNFFIVQSGAKILVNMQAIKSLTNMMRMPDILPAGI